MTLRTRLLIGCTVVDLFAGFGAAHAEFQMAGQAAPLPARVEAPDPDAVPEAVRPRVVPRVRPLPVAYGFGRQVPLSFALRQIVPKGVAITATDDIDADAVLVDWNGRRPWPDVLLAALRAPGLRATIKPGSVLIERAAVP